jgi:hypothetical protein
MQVTRCALRRNVTGAWGTIHPIFRFDGTVSEHNLDRQGDELANKSHRWSNLSFGSLDA